MQYFGEKLKSLRTEHHLTQQELANQIGLVKGSISAYEQSAKYPSVDVLIKLCKTFNVSADYLLGLSDNMELVKSNLTDEQIAPLRKIIRELESYNQLKYQEKK